MSGQSDDEEGFQVDLFAEPAGFRPSTPPPQVLRVSYDDFDGSNNAMTSSSSSSEKQSSDDLIIHMVGNHPLWGHHVWNASLNIAHYLKTHAASLIKGRSVLELGAAAGIPSLVCAREGAKTVVATDYPEKPLIDVLVKNLEENRRDSSGNTFAEGYIWGSDPSTILSRLKDASDDTSTSSASVDESPQRFDLILLSDLIFNHQAHPALLDTLDLCLDRAPSTPSVDSSNLEDPNYLVHEEAHPDFPDLATGEFTTTSPQTPCALVFFTSHRPHLADRDMNFFLEAQKRGWTVERIGRWKRDVSVWIAAS